MLKRLTVQFFAAATGAAAGAAAFAAAWWHIDRFFYITLGVEIQCDGCQFGPISLLYLFMPVAASCFLCLFTALMHKNFSPPCLLGALLASSCIGGTLSMLALEYVSGAAAAVLLACVNGTTATAGCHVLQKITGNGSPVQKKPV